ncbi:MAG: hypothetical protein AB1650_08575 [Candidatus Omnitrophota bacterium]
MNLVRICVYLILLINLSICAFADQEQQAFATHLIEQGKTLIQEKKYLEASHVLAKAMLIDPDNAEAKSLLDLLHQCSYGSKNKSVEDIFKDNTKIKLYKQEIKTLEKKIATVKTNAAEQKVKSHKIARKLRKDISSLTKILQEKENLLVQKDQELVQLNEHFCNLEDRFETAKSSWKEEKLAFVTEVSKLEEQLDTFEKKQGLLSGKIVLLEKENSNLREEIISTQRASKIQSSLEKALLENLKHVVLQKDYAISQLKKDFASSNKNISRIRELISEKNHELALLDIGVRQLQENFSSERKDWENTEISLQQQIKKMDKDLELSRKTVSAKNHGQHFYVNELNKELVKSKLALNKASRDLILTNYQIQTLKSQIDEKNNSIKGLEEKLSSLEYKLAAFNNQENIAGIEEYKQVVKGRDAVIAELKEKLADTRRQLAAIDKDIDRSQNKDFLVLKERLKDIQIRLEEQLDANIQKLK